MSVLSVDHERILEVTLELASLTPGGLGDLSVAERILAAAEKLFPNSDPRVALIYGSRLEGFARTRLLGKTQPLRLGHLELSPLVVEWMRETSRESPQRPWPSGIRSSLQIDPSRFLMMPLRGAQLPLGILGIHRASDSPHANESMERALGLLAAHAGTVVENARLYRRLEQEAETDGLTGVFNYRYFVRALAREMDRTRRGKSELAVVMVDVDNLKEYNGSFGHLGGSAALRELAQLMEEGTRSIDVVAKYGGDEFSILLPDCGWEGATALAERVRELAAAHHFEGDPARRLTVSMGLSVYPEEGSDPRDLLRRADARLFAAKSAGRNRIGSLD